MSLRDDLDSITMNQTKGYKEESPDNYKEVESINEEILGESKPQETNASKRNNPFKNNDNIDTKKILTVVLILTAVVLLAFGGFKIYTYLSQDKGASFYQEIEEGDVAAFSYSMDERDLLRVNGYTADDIERFEIEERNPSELIKESESRRKELYDYEIKPYLDGASDKYKSLESMTWIGTGDMSPLILNTETINYEERYGSYNCDFIKIPPKGSQLFVKLDLMDFNKEIFMTMTPERYNELPESGNIVVVIEYNKYADDSILVTDVQEKDIKQ